MKDGVFVIAEAGVNHNGSLDRALELVDGAAAAGADAVKFQTFRAASLATKAAPKAKYQERAPVAETDQFSMLAKLELDEAAHEKLAARCRERGIEFMSTPFDVESVGMLDRLGMKRFKVPSGEIDNPLLLRAVAATGKPLIISTGMATLAEVEFALRTVAHAITSDPDAFWSDDGARLLADRVTLLHCTTEYPAPASAVNLRAMVTLANAFSVPVGYSDHTLGAAVSCGAVALGAVVVEKHFTTDRTLPGPDHAASLDLRELRSFVDDVRSVRQALGRARKVPSTVEIPNRAVARRSVVASAPIAKGGVFTERNVTLKRPGTGIPASRYDEVLGRTADRDYDADDLIVR